MNYVNDFKNKLRCCIAKKTALLIKDKENLIFNSKLENQISLLNLLDFSLADVECFDSIDSKIKSKVLSICGFDDCSTCSDDNFRVILENWIEDENDYSTKWIIIDECCEQDLRTKWVSIDECCENAQLETKWIPLDYCCISNNKTKWIPLDYCCEEYDLETKWVSFIECCEETLNI